MILNEYISPSMMHSSAMLEESLNPITGISGKSLYLKGICIQGDVRNANQRIYPISEIARAINVMKSIIKEHQGIGGELDHPADLKINTDRISHYITDVWMEGANGYGKMKILSTPMGLIAKTLIEEGVKLGVSSRGSGNVNESTGHVSDFEIITVDIVTNPSAPNAYPTPLYENLLNMRGGSRLLEIAKDPAAQRFIKNDVINMIKGLGIK